MRANGAQFETAIECHTFRATGITDYLPNGGKLEVAQRMARHFDVKTSGLYDKGATMSVCLRPRRSGFDETVTEAVLLEAKAKKGMLKRASMNEEE